MLRILICRDTQVVKEAGLKILWLSAFEGSNPSPCIKIMKSRKELTDTVNRTLGLIRHFGPENIILYAQKALGQAVLQGICSRRDVDSAINSYREDYASQVLKKLFS